MDPPPLRWLFLDNGGNGHEPKSNHPADTRTIDMDREDPTTRDTGVGATIVPRPRERPYTALRLN
jgi:hypothetical protein